MSAEYCDVIIVLTLSLVDRDASTINRVDHNAMVSYSAVLDAICTERPARLSQR